MFYRLFRAVANLALRLFYRLNVSGGSIDLSGPVIFVGNHPNGLVDPGLVFILTPRHVTFLAKAPLFKIPVIAQVVKGMGALPVYRKQDDPAQMGRNEGTLEASAGALIQGRAITIFPEGRSHSEPQLSDLKTGCARIALRAARANAPVRIIPIGLTYEEKTRFRSAVQIKVGDPLEVTPFLSRGEEEAQVIRALTEQIGDELRQVTINLEQWEDLPLIETAEELYALRLGEQAKDPDRLQAFSRGVALLRAEQPERFEALRRDVASFKRRLDLVRASGPSDLAVEYRPAGVTRFVLRNLAALVFGFPVFLVGMVLFAVPFAIPPQLVRIRKVPDDIQATVKVLTLFLLAPLWWAGLTALAWNLFGWPVGVASLIGVPPLALYTRYFYERRKSALLDVRTFFVLGSRKGLKARLLAEGEKLAEEIERIAGELRPRVVA